MHGVRATEEFVGLVRSPHGDVPLDHAALLIAAHAHPGLDIAAQQSRLDELADGVGAPTLDGIRRHLFRDLGFRGNRDDYYDPENSFLDTVLDRRLGIPISLAVVTLEVASRLAVPLVGVAMPGHFLVGDKVDPDLYIDVFSGGAELSVDDCAALVAGIFGDAAPFDRSTMLPEVDNRDIIARMLLNLRAIYTQTDQPGDLRWVLRLLAELTPADATGWESLADVETRIGRFASAADHYDQAAALQIGHGDVEAGQASRAKSQRARARLN